MDEKFTRFEEEFVDPKSKIPEGVKPLFDYWLRDTHIALCNDNYYYLTGTTRMEGTENAKIMNDGISLWRSFDLKDWEEYGLVWTFEEHGTWQNKFIAPEDAQGNIAGPGKRAVYAPEIYSIKNNFYITACMNWPRTKRNPHPGGNFLLESITGLPQGPYKNVTEGVLCDRIDSSIFVDDDGTVYYVWQNGMIAKMKEDMIGFAEEPRLMVQQHFDPEPYVEGAFVFKHNGLYHLCLAIWTREIDGRFGYFPGGESTKISYDCIIASSENIYGPYCERYTSITAGGHNSFFTDKDGNWWATMFGNPVNNSYAPFYARPAIIPMKWEGNRIYPDQDWFDNNYLVMEEL